MSHEAIRVITPFPLTEEQRTIIRSKMERLLGGETFALQEEIDQSLIGGVVILVRDWIIDCSIKTQLEQIKERVLRIE